MARYEVSSDIPLDENYRNIIQEYLEKQGYDFSFVFGEDKLFAVLTLEGVLDENDLHIFSHFSPIKEFVRVED